MRVISLLMSDMFTNECFFIKTRAVFPAHTGAATIAKRHVKQCTVVVKHAPANGGGKSALNLVGNVQFLTALVL